MGLIPMGDQYEKSIKMYELTTTVSRSGKERLLNDKNVKMLKANIAVLRYDVE